MWPFKKDRHTQFEQLVGPHLKQLYKLAYRYTGQRDDAEDLVQDVLLKLFPRLEEMQSVDKLGPWLSRVLYRQYVDQYRRQQRSPITYMDDEETVYETHASEQAGPAAVTNNEMTHQVLEQALNQLNEDQRILIMLNDVEGYSLQEINEMLDIPVGTLKSRLSRARNKLREIIHKTEPETELARVIDITG